MLPPYFVAVPRPRWVDTQKSAEELLSYLSTLGSMPVAIDTETTGLNRQKDTVVVWSLSDGRRRYVILAELLPMFVKFFQEYPRLIFHNANFDTDMLNNSGVDLQVGEKLGRRYDTIVMHHWLNQNLPVTRK
mgnify:CR=1 FL=1